MSDLYGPGDDKKDFRVFDYLTLISLTKTQMALKV